MTNHPEDGRRRFSFPDDPGSTAEPAPAGAARWVAAEPEQGPRAPAAEPAPAVRGRWVAAEPAGEGTPASPGGPRPATPPPAEPAGWVGGEDEGDDAPAPGGTGTDIRVLQPGDTSKADPFTILFIANPALETLWNSGTFQADPIMNDRGAFDDCVAYAVDCLLGRLPGQQEQLLADPSIGSRVRIVSVFPAGRPAADANALVAEDSVSNLLVARRQVFVPFVAGLGAGPAPDVIFAISGSKTHDRASSWFTSDNNAGPGYDFVLDGVTWSHRFYSLVPGTVALHATSRAITPLHEFGHALSSYENGSVVDLYVDNDPALNNKRARPIPSGFATYESSSLAVDASRDGIGYPGGWQSYHCERLAPEAPAVMDNYFQASDGPVACAHDRITRAFLHDRLTAKLSR